MLIVLQTRLLSNWIGGIFFLLVVAEVAWTGVELVEREDEKHVKLESSRDFIWSQFLRSCLTKVLCWPRGSQLHTRLIT